MKKYQVFAALFFLMNYSTCYAFQTIDFYNMTKQSCKIIKKYKNSTEAVDAKPVIKHISYNIKKKTLSYKVHLSYQEYADNWWRFNSLDADPVSIDMPFHTFDWSTPVILQIICANHQLDLKALPNALQWSIPAIPEIKNFPVVAYNISDYRVAFGAIYLFDPS
mgnify:CR=1 FL=1